MASRTIRGLLGNPLRAGRGRASFAVLVLALLGCASIEAQTNFGSAPLGQGVTQSVSVGLHTAGTVAVVRVLTWGAANADFTAAATGSTCANNTFAVSQTCAVAVTFTPVFPGLRCGAVVLLDSAGSELATRYLVGTGVGAVGILVPGAMTTVAGNGQWTSIGDGQLATLAELFLPSSVVADGAGNMYIADSVHNRIRRVDGATNIISTIAGNSDPGYGGDGGPAANAVLNTPRGLAIDGAGNIYIADTGNNVIRKIAASTGMISTIAGNGVSGFGGDNGQAIDATLASPSGIAVDPGGRFYIADTANHRIRRVDPVTGRIKTVAGNGRKTVAGAGSYSGDGGPAVDAGLNFPYAVAFDSLGNMYIPDSGNNRIRVVAAASGDISTFAGVGSEGYAGDAGPASLARLASPSGVAFDAAGNLYIADTQNNRIRVVNAQTGWIASIAGNGTGKYAGDQAAATSAGLFGPYSVFVDAEENLLIADYFDHRIRKVSSGTSVLTFSPAVRVGQVSAPQTQTVEDGGNAPLSFGAIAPDANAAIDAASTTCVAGTSLASDTTCAIGIEFAPTEAGIRVTGNISIAGAFLNAPLDIQAVGAALSLNSTSVLVSSSANPAAYGKGVEIFAAVSTGTGTPAGTVSFTDGGLPLGSAVALDSSANASYTLAAPTLGQHSILAAYNGDALHLPSVSGPFVLVVEEATATTLTSSQNPAALNAALTLTASVAPVAGGLPPSGTVAFKNGATFLGNATVDAAGNASLVVPANPGGIGSLAAGDNAITATYSGMTAAYILGSTSAVLNEEIQAPTTSQIGSSADPSVYGQTVLLTATVSSTAAIPAGEVDFYDGAKLLGSALLGTEATGAPTTATAQLAISNLTVGLHSISAVYAGGVTTSGSASPPLTQTVETAPTTIVETSTPNPSIAAAPVLIAAKVDGGSGIRGGDVVFLADGASLGSAPIDLTGAASLTTSSLPVGQHLLTADYEGDGSNAPSISSALAFTVQAIATSTSLVVSAPGANQQETLTATVVGVYGPIPTGVVSFQSGATALGSAALNSSGVATLAVSLGLGSVGIVASYPGDELHAPSTSPRITAQILAPGFQLTLTPASLTLVSGQNGNATLTLISNSGFADRIGLGCASLPPIVTCHFSGETVDLAANAAPTVQLTVDTDSPLSGGAVAGNVSPADPRKSSFHIASAALPLGALFDLCVWGLALWVLRRRRSGKQALMLALLVLAATACQLLGCGSIRQDSAAPGTYAIQVVGIGVNSGIDQSASFTLTVTK